MALQRLKLIIVDNETNATEVIEFDSYQQLREFVDKNKGPFIEVIKQAVTSLTEPSPKKFLQNELRTQVQQKKKTIATKKTTTRARFDEDI